MFTSQSGMTPISWWWALFTANASYEVLSLTQGNSWFHSNFTDCHDAYQIVVSAVRCWCQLRCSFQHNETAEFMLISWSVMMRITLWWGPFDRQHNGIETLLSTKQRTKSCNWLSMSITQFFPLFCWKEVLFATCVACSMIMHCYLCCRSSCLDFGVVFQPWPLTCLHMTCMRLRIDLEMHRCKVCNLSVMTAYLASLDL